MKINVLNKYMYKLKNKNDKNVLLYYYYLINK